MATATDLWVALRSEGRSCAVLREAAYDREPLGQPILMSVCRQGRPREHGGGQKVPLSALFGEINELQEQSLCPTQLESERTTDRQVIHERVS